jgi:hypothetical protein
MVRGLIIFLIATVALLALASPVLIVARRQGRQDTIRNFVIGALVIALVYVTIELVSQRQVEQCIAAGNHDCVDAGAGGLQLLFVGSYVVGAWMAAMSMYRG